MPKSEATKRRGRPGRRGRGSSAALSPSSASVRRSACSSSYTSSCFTRMRSARNRTSVPSAKWPSMTTGRPGWNRSGMPSVRRTGTRRRCRRPRRWRPRRRSTGSSTTRPWSRNRRVPSSSRWATASSALRKYSVAPDRPFRTTKPRPTTTRPSTTQASGMARRRAGPGDRRERCGGAGRCRCRRRRRGRARAGVVRRGRRSFRIAPAPAAVGHLPATRRPRGHRRRRRRCRRRRRRPSRVDVADAVGGGEDGGCTGPPRRAGGDGGVEQGLLGLVLEPGQAEPVDQQPGVDRPKATNPRKRVNSCRPSILTSRVPMVASWCRLRHQSTAKWTMGTLTNAAMPTMAARGCAPRCRPGCGGRPGSRGRPATSAPWR